MVAQQLLAGARCREAEALDRGLGDVYTPGGEVLVDVAQDVRHLHRPPERGHALASRAPRPGLRRRAGPRARSRLSRRRAGSSARSPRRRRSFRARCRGASPGRTLPAARGAADGGLRALRGRAPRGSRAPSRASQRSSDSTRSGALGSSSSTRSSIVRSTPYSVRTSSFVWPPSRRIAGANVLSSAASSPSRTARGVAAGLFAWGGVAHRLARHIVAHSHRERRAGLCRVDSEHRDQRGRQRDRQCDRQGEQAELPGGGVVDGRPGRARQPSVDQILAEQAGEHSDHAAAEQRDAGLVEDQPGELGWAHADRDQRVEARPALPHGAHHQRDHGGDRRDQHDDRDLVQPRERAAEHGADFALAFARALDGQRGAGRKRAFDQRFWWPGSMRRAPVRPPAASRSELPHSRAWSAPFITIAPDSQP